MNHSTLRFWRCLKEIPSTYYETYPFFRFTPTADARDDPKTPEKMVGIVPPKRSARCVDLLPWPMVSFQVSRSFSPMFLRCHPGRIWYKRSQWQWPIPRTLRRRYGTGGRNFKTMWCPVMDKLVYNIILVNYGDIYHTHP